MYTCTPTYTSNKACGPQCCRLGIPSIDSAPTLPHLRVLKSDSPQEFRDWVWIMCNALQVSFNVSPSNPLPTPLPSSREWPLDAKPTTPPFPSLQRRRWVAAHCTPAFSLRFIWLCSPPAPKLLSAFASRWPIDCF